MKYIVLAVALLSLAVACNKKEETNMEAAPTVEQTAPATEPAPEAAPTTEAAPMDAAPVDAAPAAGAPSEAPAQQ